MQKMTSQLIQKAQGRPMLVWAGKKPLDKIEYYPAQEKEVYGDLKATTFNRLYWGDNLQVLAHLLKQHRGAVDLIYIDPPFDSKAEYIKKVKIRGEEVSGEQQSLIEEKQYNDIWKNDEYLQFMYERLLIARELLSDTGSIYLHCDWHKGAYLRLIMDEVFGEENFVNEIIWHYRRWTAPSNDFQKLHDNLFWYSKNKACKVYNPVWMKPANEEKGVRESYERDEDGKLFRWQSLHGKRYKIYRDERGVQAGDVWDISFVHPSGGERTDYPTQKPEELLERIIKATSNESDLVLDFFCGSGTTLAAAQKLNRRWIGCDINRTAIQTTIKRLSNVLQEQTQAESNKQLSLNLGDEPTLPANIPIVKAFKVYNVNDYDVFKNELEAKQIIVDTYGIHELKRCFFDGILDGNFVKILPINRVLNKTDIKAVIDGIEKDSSNFTVKGQTKTGESVYREKVYIVCSGFETDVLDFIRVENKTGVDIEIKNILKEKENLIFKKHPEADIKIKHRADKLILEIKDFYSPILLRKLEIENKQSVASKNKTKVTDFRQAIDSAAIDPSYNGKLFSAVIIDIPDKKELIKATYEITHYKKTIAVKIVDILGEEYFQTFSV